MGQGAWVLVVVLAVAAAFGAYRASQDGRFRGTHPVHGAASRPGGTSDADPTPGGTSDADPTGGGTSDADPTGAASRPQQSVLDGAHVDHELGERATLLQFSSAFCAPCRATRRVLADVADAVPGVRHVEIDAEHHLELVRRLNVLRTPTTLVLDTEGREVSRATGAPRKEAVLATLARVVADRPAE